MNVKSLRDQAKINGLKEVLDERMKNSSSDQLVTQLKHILSMIDQDEDELRKANQDHIIEEDEAEDDEEYEGVHHKKAISIG